MQITRRLIICAMGSHIFRTHNYACISSNHSIYKSPLSIVLIYNFYHSSHVIFLALAFITSAHLKRLNEEQPINQNPPKVCTFDPSSVSVFSSSLHLQSIYRLTFSNLIIPYDVEYLFSINGCYYSNGYYFQPLLSQLFHVSMFFFKGYCFRVDWEAYAGPYFRYL